MSIFEWKILVRAGNANFRLGKIPKEDGSMRELEIPKDRLKEIHGRINRQLSLLPAPPYLHSGKKKRSSLTNGRLHREAQFALTMDVRKFYPSCLAEAVFEFFRYYLGMPIDIATPLVSIVTYGGHIPTGSPLSQSLAFWSKAQAFDEIYRYACNRGYLMTLYVDDISISSVDKPIPGHTCSDIAGILKKHQLKVKKSKTRFYAPHEAKRFTGNVVLPGGTIEAPFKLKKKLFRTILGPISGDLTRLEAPALRSALGVLRTIRTVEEAAVYPTLYGNLVKQTRIAEELETANAVAATLARQASRITHTFNPDADF